MADETQVRTPIDLPFDVHRWAESPALDCAVDQLADAITTGEGRQKSRNDDAAHRFKTAIKVLLLNLFQAWSLGPQTTLGISLRSGSYSSMSRYSNSHLAYRQFKAAFEGLKTLGLLEISRRGSHNRETGEGRVTRVVATEKLGEMYKKADLSHFDVVLSPTYETIRLKNERGSTQEYEDTNDTIRMRSNLSRINHVLHRHWPDIELSREEWDHLQERLAQERLALDSKRNPIDLSKRYLYRVFNNGTFDMGGRFYGGWWQNVPSSLRPYIRIDGKRTVEIDYSSIHPRILYAKERLSVPEDPYDIGLDPRFRKAVKQTFNALVNAPSNHISPVSSFDADAIGMSWRDFKNVVRSGFEPIAKYFGTGEGVRLQKADSDILEKVLLHFATQGIPCLPVHDSVIIHHGYADVLTTIMVEAFEEVTGIPGMLKDTLGVSRPREVRVSADGNGELEDLFQPDPLFQDFDDRLERWYASQSKTKGLGNEPMASGHQRET